jgi:hypothetical protein
MESTMKRQEAKKKIQEIQHQQDVENFESNLNRSRSIMVGTAFGGTTEISMRGNGDKFLYCIMQPVEVIELIHQLAANVGCHIALKPRDDFSSWREWRVPESEKKHLNGHTPFVNDMAVFQRLGAAGFNQQEAEAVMEEWLSQKEYEYVNGGAQIKKEVKNETVAIKKPKNGRKLKRPAASA